jgi:hypothetical protein
MNLSDWALAICAVVLIIFLYNVADGRIVILHTPMVGAK